MRRLPLLVAPLLALLVAGIPARPALAEEPGGATAMPNLTPEMLAKLKDGGDDAGGGRFKDAKDVLDGLEEIDGLLPLYRSKADDKKGDPEKLLCKVPKRLLGEDMLAASSIASGGQFTGWMWQDNLVRWEIADKQLKLVTPDTRYTRKKGDPLNDVIDRTYNDTFIASTPIIAMTPQGDPIIDLSELLKSDLAGVQFMGGRVKRNLSTWGAIKNFPDNTLVNVNLALGNGDGGRTVGVTYAFRRLPKLGEYSARMADPRVGYFLTAQLDWAKKPQEREMFDRMINRWRLEKRDPSLELSPPKEPIVFYIEKTVPIRWRRWVRAGIEEWNKAYEKIGYSDAIVVYQQTDDNEFANIDPEDARYNFFRWIVSGRAFAMGPSRVDPRTGQILDADIIMDESIVRAWIEDFDLLGPSAIAAMKGEGFAEYAAAYPDLVPQSLRGVVPGSAADGGEDLMAIALRQLHENGHDVCTLATGLQQQMHFAHQAMIATGTGKQVPEQFIGEVIKHVVTHEVGHTLGLRHNFKASSWLSLDEMKQRRDTTDEPWSASVMDYNPIMFFAGDKADQVRHFMSPAIGPYDYFAIQYGYGSPGKGQNEEQFLGEVANRSTEKELNYATDEDTVWVYSPDPSVNRWDAASNPIDYARSRSDLCGDLITKIRDWAVKENEPRYFLTQAFNSLWFERIRNFEYVSRVVGGQYFNRDNVGQENARPAFELVSAADQRAALKYLGETVFNPSYFVVDAALLNDLAPSRWSHWGSNMGVRVDFPIHERILALQSAALVNVTSPPILQRVYDAEMKCGDDDRFTAAELITTVRDMIWGASCNAPKGKCTDAKPFVCSVTRNLQNEYLNIMLSATQLRPGQLISADLHAMIRYALRDLSGQIGAVLDKGGDKLDFASRAHLSESKSRIDRMLEAQYQAR